MQEINLTAGDPFKNGIRYIKFDRLTAIPASTGNINIVEIMIQKLSDGINFCRQPGVVATASSSYVTENPSMAIDGVTGTNDANRWTSAYSTQTTDYNTTPHWFQIDLGQPRIFDSIQMVSWLTSGQLPRHMDIKASLDGVAWKTMRMLRDLAFTSLVYKELWK